MAVLAAPAAVQEQVLDNGLKVLVVEDHRAPVVVSQVWYRVGSSHERSGSTGISHVLEHMMFKGTETRGPGEFSRAIAAAGGRENAFTSRDYTAYFQSLAADRLALAFELEADRMANLVMDPAELERELRVVLEERRLRTDDSPEGRAREQFRAAAFLTGPYRNPVIGWRADLERLSAEQVRAWYEAWYAPNNAVLVVAGDVAPDEVFGLAERHFGAVPSRAIPEHHLRPEIPQQGERRIVVKAAAELPYLSLAYKVPTLSTAGEPWEPYALDVLAGVLDGGRSARLNRTLVRGSRLAASVRVGYGMTARLQTLFTIAANPTPGTKVDALERAMREEVERVREAPVGPEELSRVVAQVLASEVYQRDSLYYQALRVGALEAVGLGWRVAEDYAERIQAVTAEQVQRVARRYLTGDRLTVGTMVPMAPDS